MGKYLLPSKCRYFDKTYMLMFLNNLLSGKGLYSYGVPWKVERIFEFDLQVTLMLATEFQVNRHFCSGEEAKNRFQDGGNGGHLGFPIETIYASLGLQVSAMLHAEFHLSWSFGSGEKAKNRFSRWPPRRPS